MKGQSKPYEYTDTRNQGEIMLTEGENIVGTEMIVTLISNNRTETLAPN